MSLGGVVAGSINTNPIEQKVEIPVDPEISPAQTMITKSPKVQLNLLDFVPVIRNLRALKKAKKAKILEPDTYFVPKGELVLELRDSTDSLIFEKREKLTISSVSSWEKLMSNVEIKEDGNLKVYIDNSSSDKVYFDEFIIERTEAAVAVVVQENHYYPFGMNMKGIEELDLQSLDSKDEHRFQYNGKEKEESFGLYWNDHGARNLDVQLGRWNGVDPLAEKFVATSSYVAMLNNPIRFVDLDGREAEDVPISGRKLRRQQRRQERLNNRIDKLKDDMNSFNDQVSAGSMSRQEIERTGKSFDRQMSKINKGFARANRRRDNGKIGRQVSQGLKVTGGIKEAVGSGSNTTSAGESITGGSAYAYINSALITNEDGSQSPVPNNAVVLDSKVGVNLKVSGSSFNVTVAGSSNIRLSGATSTMTNPNILFQQDSFSGNFSATFDNPTPASASQSMLPLLTNPNNTAGFGINVTPLGSSGTAQLTVSIEVEVFIPFRIDTIITDSN